MAEQGFSHPERPVRHSYPVRVADDGLMTAVGLFLRTTPIILVRLGVLVGFTLASIVWFLLSAGAGALIGRITTGQVGMWAFLIGVGLPAGVFAWLRRYVLYALKLAHVAVLTRLITHGELEPGTDQLQYGKAAVTARFGELNLLFVMDALVHGVVGSFLRTVDWFAGFIPIPGLSGIMRFADAVLRNATTYIDETIFSYNLARGDENQWRSAKDGLVYYAQNWKPVLKTAAWAVVLEYALSAASFFALLAPCLALGSVFPRLGGWAILVGVILAMNLRSAVFRPLLLTMVAVTFHKAAEGQAIDSQLEGTLGSVSDKFRELGDRARGWAPGAVSRPAGALGQASA